ncbi:HYR domain-containing protein, partial [Jejudonia soesokkakensis]
MKKITLLLILFAGAIFAQERNNSTDIEGFENVVNGNQNSFYGFSNPSFIGDPIDPTQPIEVAIGLDTEPAGFTVRSGTQLGRINRNGVASACPSKVYPGAFNTTTTYNYTAIQFINTSSTSECVTINFDPNSGSSPCGVNGHAHIYQEAGGANEMPFDPSDRGTNYLGDSGISATVSYSFTVEPGFFEVVFSTTGAGSSSPTANCNVQFAFAPNGGVITGVTGVQPDGQVCANDTPATISPAMPGAVVTATVNIAGTGEIGEDTNDFRLDNVFLDTFQHDEANTLTVELTDPSGTVTHTLFSNVGGIDGLTVAKDITFEDGTNDITTWTSDATFNDPYEAQGGPLNGEVDGAFEGVSIQGDWTLTITNGGNSGGSLQGFCLEFTNNGLVGTVPVISCPEAVPGMGPDGTLTVDNDPGQCGAVISFSDASAVDAEDGPLTVTRTDMTGLNSDDEFPVGTTVLTFEATDSDGNTVSCDFTIVVNDVDAPELTCPADIMVENDMGICGAEVIFDLPEIMDNCPAPGELAGFTTLGVVNGKTYYLSDTAFQASEAYADALAHGGFVVTITDATQNAFLNDAVNTAEGTPTSFWIGYNDVATEGSFVWQSGDSSTYTNWNAGEPNNVGGEDYGELRGFNGMWNDLPDSAGALRQYVLEIPGGLEQTAGPASGEEFPVGTTTVSFMYTDIGGNSTSCSFDVTVEDTEAPVIDCSQANTDLVLDANGMATFDLSTLNILSDTNLNVYALKAFDDTDNVGLYSYNPLTDEITLENAAVSSTGFDSHHDLAYNPVTQTAYFIRSNGGSAPRELFEYDLLTGASTLIASPIEAASGNNRVQAMTFGPDGTMYLSFQDGSIDTYDIATQTATAFANVPTDGGVGITFDYDNNRIIHSTNLGSVDSSNDLSAIDASTGDVTFLFNYRTPGTNDDCTGQALAYVGNDKILASSTFGCNLIYTIDVSMGTTNLLLQPNGFDADIKSLVALPSNILDNCGATTITTVAPPVEDGPCDLDTNIEDPATSTTIWDRPVGTGPTISGLGPVSYHVYGPFMVSSDGNYTIDSTQDYDGYIHLYEIAFDPTDQLTNLLAGNDDGPGGIGTSQIVDQPLVTGTEYFLVTSAFAAANFGNFTNSITGPGSVSCVDPAAVLTMLDFTCDDVGENMIDVTVTDTAGNSSTCSAMINVIDDTAPEVACMDFTLELDDNGVATLDPNDAIDEDATVEACGYEATASRTDFSCADIGTPVMVDIFV